jgi:anti-sigma factor ChrR (cupin superfamily)
VKTIHLALEVSDHLEKESRELLESIGPSHIYPAVGDRIVALIRAGLRQRARILQGRHRRRTRSG